MPMTIGGCCALRSPAATAFSEAQHDIFLKGFGGVSRGRFLDDQMGFAGGAGDNAEAENFGYDLRGVGGAVDAVIGGLIGREALRVEGAETFFIAEERAAGHGHAAAEEDFGGR